MISLIILWKDREPGNLEIHNLEEAVVIIGDFLSNPDVKRVVAIRGSMN